MDEEDILKTVESMLGKNVKIVDCEKTSSVREEEVLLINGIPVTLEGDDGDAIKTALMTGQVPPCDLLNQLLYQAGILRQPVQLETSLSVKSTMVTKEEVTVARDGRVLDERTSETKEDNYYTSSCKEIWQPVRPVKPVDGAAKNSIPMRSDLVPSPNLDEAKRKLKLPFPSRHQRSVSSDNISRGLRPSLSSSPVSHSLCTESSGTTEPSSSYSSIATNDLCIHESSSGDGDSCRALHLNNNNCIHATVDNSLTGSCKDLPKNASLSCDSGHDDVFTSPSHTNVLQTANTDNSISSCYDFISSDEADFGNNRSVSRVHSSLYMPTIFGTVASGHCPKDSSNRRGLPQTTTKSADKQPSQSLAVSVDCPDPHPDSDENALVYRDGNLISGPLDALILHMVPTSEYYPDRSYLFAFLLSARLFIRPHELLEKVCRLGEEQQGILAEDAPTDLEGTDAGEKLCTFAQHFVQLLAEWIDTFPYDFRDERLMQHVRAMTRKCINIHGSLRKDVSAMLQNLLYRLTVLEKYEDFLQSLARGSSDCADLTGLISGGGGGLGGIRLVNTTADSAPTQHLPQHHQQGNTTTIVSQASSATNSASSLISSNASSTAAADISELCPNPTLLAHQLTHIELERLSHIGPEEFVQAFAKENPHLEQSFSDMKKTRNLESYVQWFNRLSYLVATEIVKHPKKKQRVRVVEYWIETARECFNIGNFNSLMAIIAGLNMSPISRLKKTWAKVQSAKFAVLEHQMDPSSNFNSYRSTLKAAMWRSAGATDERERIVIPFFSLLVKDLYFLNEGCSNKLPNGHINFEKFWQLAKQVTEFIAWKQVTCPFEKLPNVIMFLQTNHVLNENSLAMASFECEPPENHEKDRYKCLKSEQHLHAGQ